jgi:hypothetical protein
MTVNTQAAIIVTGGGSGWAPPVHSAIFVLTEERKPGIDKMVIPTARFPRGCHMS